MNEIVFGERDGGEIRRLLLARKVVAYSDTASAMLSMLIRWYRQLPLYTIDSPLYCSNISFFSRDIFRICDKGDFFNIYIFGKWQSTFSLLLVKSEKIIFGRYIFRASSSLLISPLVSTKAYCIHSFWSQNTEKRNTTISQMRLRSVFKMRMSILNTATTEQMGYGSISFFVCFL